jgi:hypothetical protein
LLSRARPARFFEWILGVWKNFQTTRIWSHILASWRGGGLGVTLRGHSAKSVSQKRVKSSGIVITGAVSQKVQVREELPP